jgi:hypothetical protein
MNTDLQAQNTQPRQSASSDESTQSSQLEGTPLPDDPSPQDLAWSTPISQEWGKIYGRFIEDTEAMIQRSGGKRKVDVQSYGGDSFHHLGLHLDRLGGEREPEVQKALPASRAKFLVRSRQEDCTGTYSVNLLPVVGGSEENARFYQATPSGEIVLGGLQPAVAHQFMPGKQFYVNFEEAL